MAHSSKLPDATIPPIMRSLFILSLPRSLSTLTYELARRALRLRTPSWTMDGEILNLDRMAMYRGPRIDECAKFTTEELDPDLFAQITDFLSEIAVPEGFIYKDVVQPFVVSAWPGLQGLRAIRIERDIAEVAFSMLHQGWYYPREAVGAPAGHPPGEEEPLPDVKVITRYLEAEARTPAARGVPFGDQVQTLVEGLIRADRSLARAPAETLTYEDLVTNEGALTACLTRLYPGDRVRTIYYMDVRFRREHAEQLRRRDTALYRWLRAMVVERQAQTVALGTNSAQNAMRETEHGTHRQDCGVD